MPLFQELEITASLNYSQSMNWALLEVYEFFQTNGIPFTAWGFHSQLVSDRTKNI